MPDVEEAIAKYNDVVDQLQSSIVKRDKIIDKQAEELKRVKGELHNMQLEMSMLELPDMHQVQEQIILNNFAGSKGVKDPVEPPKEVERRPEDPKIDIPIVGGEDEEDTIVDVSGASPYEIVE